MCSVTVTAGCAKRRAKAGVHRMLYVYLSRWDSGMCIVRVQYKRAVQCHPDAARAFLLSRLSSPTITESSSLLHSLLPH